ncbi:hypothetical protein [Hyalangium rubrum]|uniref:Lipoprotein n=1 Tax=Hyalangium rubrum TaxID=3103134 RepID=A0ABU5GXH3_9BACT|nr:hypothetical protein [Hyalangium sp. s54d21]MDY7225893.1 hypothetical protein [Hyalangium sp. s54d21]
MALKTGFFSLALGALLLGSTAQAADAQAEHSASGVGAQTQSLRGSHGNGNRYRNPRPSPPANQQGRYELKVVQKWVPARYEQVWVPQECKYKPRRNTTKCEGGYYEQRQVPGHYEQVEEWVWVPASRYGRWNAVASR